MSSWRLLGKLPPARSRERLGAQFLGDWNPWESPWIPSPARAIVVSDPHDPTRSRHVPLFSVEQNGARITFGAERALSGMWRFYVPAKPGEPSSFEASSANYEGFWRRSPSDPDDLPWPQPDPLWGTRISFLIALDRVEANAEPIPSRGFSFCRLCHCRNGSRSYRFCDWEWPEGLRHYIAKHQVRPSARFEQFIRTYALFRKGTGRA
ncbi:hypothetical protein DYQ86_19260 [Acidobacteria bacterium AB60]|nr:hypothetical protein DYQ86_19260 [Acidobacteria bacterium AB60]